MGLPEVIKHACIKDAVLFATLEKFTLHDFNADQTLIAELIERNVKIKTAVVVNDEFEQGDRKLLNFGHTIGHAIENIYHLLHGHAISIGMIAPPAIFPNSSMAFHLKTPKGSCNCWLNIIYLLIWKLNMKKYLRY